MGKQLFASNGLCTPCLIKEELGSLLCSIIRCGSRGIARIDFLKEVSPLLLNFFKCDALIIQLYQHGKIYSYEIIKQKRQPQRIIENYYTKKRPEDIELMEDVFLEQDVFELLLSDNRFEFSGDFFSNRGSFYTKEKKGIYEFFVMHMGKKTKHKYRIESEYHSLVMIPLKINEESIGLIQLKAQSTDFFTENNVEFCETIAETVGLAALDRSVQLSLRERVKELSCLYRISKILEIPDYSLDEILKKIVDLLPPAWLYPDIAAAKIVVNGCIYTTKGFRDTPYKLVSEIVVEGEKRGVVEVLYLKEMPEIHEGPFLLEERNLINAVSQQISYIIKLKHDEEENEKLQVQLRHADRLATVGQLSAGIAHELNEPLASILGFAQLLKDEQGLLEQAEKDIKKIESASLYAREIVKKLLLFSRQIPQIKKMVNLNHVIEDTFFFFESRCVKEGIKVIKDLDSNLPEISADYSQIQQVVVNLVVNAIQAMKYGDTLTITTNFDKTQVILTVQDTGTGMSEEVKKQLFVPFFTTKGIDRGTGLGLPVVHGIVMSHGGSVSVESEPGKGSVFKIKLPRDNNSLKTG